MAGVKTGWYPGGGWRYGKTGWEIGSGEWYKVPLSDTYHIVSECTIRASAQSPKLKSHLERTTSASATSSSPYSLTTIARATEVDSTPRRSVNSLRNIKRRAPIRRIEVHVRRIVVPNVTAPAGDDAAAAAEVVEEACAAASAVVFGVVVHDHVPVDVGALKRAGAGDAVVAGDEAGWAG